ISTRPNWAKWWPLSTSCSPSASTRSSVPCSWGGRRAALAVRRATAGPASRATCIERPTGTAPRRSTGRLTRKRSPHGLLLHRCPEPWRAQARGVRLGHVRFRQLWLHHGGAHGGVCRLLRGRGGRRHVLGHVCLDALAEHLAPDRDVHH